MYHARCSSGMRRKATIEESGGWNKLFSMRTVYGSLDWPASNGLESTENRRNWYFADIFVIER